VPEPDAPFIRADDDLDQHGSQDSLLQLHWCLEMVP